MAFREVAVIEVREVLRGLAFGRAWFALAAQGRRIDPATPTTRYGSGMLRCRSRTNLGLLSGGAGTLSVVGLFLTAALLLVPFFWT
jgi:hypothetical protein